MLCSCRYATCLFRELAKVADRRQGFMCCWRQRRRCHVVSFHAGTRVPSLLVFVSGIRAQDGSDWVGLSRREELSGRCCGEPNVLVLYLQTTKEKAKESRTIFELCLLKPLWAGLSAHCVSSSILIYKIFLPPMTLFSGRLSPSLARLLAGANSESRTSCSTDARQISARHSLTGPSLPAVEGYGGAPGVRLRVEVG